MGESALTSHAKGAKHKGLVTAMSSSTLRAHVHATGPTAIAATGTSSAAAVDHGLAAGASPLDVRGHASQGPTALYHGNSHLKAETLWALNLVAKNYSFKSCEGTGELFQAMFPDSAITKQFQCAETKARYMVTFGIAPHLQRQVRDLVKEAKDYVVLFDESLNDALQSKQLDVLVRLWDANEVQSRYYTSKFLSHTYAETLQDEIYECCVDLGLAGMHQLSMDGPNVNWKAFDLLSDQTERGT